MAHTDADLERLAGAGLAASPVTEVLIEESVLGWKEYELELMRDRHDNVVVVCSIENLDPMGVHTGDSITVAPAMTLTDREYQHMRDVGIAVLRAVGVDTGGCNIQFAVHPETGRLVVIEMNPRVSRSSALASKATGFPIAKIAARLAVGYTLDEIRNDITGETPAAFEPTLDYVVVKIPRFAFEKFPGADPELTTTMKSVGEAMALGPLVRRGAGQGAALDGDRGRRVLDRARTRPRRPTSPPRPTGGSTASSGCCGRACPWPRWRGGRASTRGSSTRSTGSSALRAEIVDAPVLDARAAAAGQAGGPLRPPAGRAAPRARRRGRRAHAAAPAGRAAGVQDRRHLRRRVRRAHPVPLQRLRDRPRGRVGDRAADRRGRRC